MGELVLPFTSYLEDVTTHVEKHFGPVESVLHELVSEIVHIDILVVKPTKTHPFLLLITSGMSDLAMKVDQTHDDPGNVDRAELIIKLPAKGPHANLFLNKKFEGGPEDLYCYPVDVLRHMAKMPHAFATWLGVGHTTANGEPPKPWNRDTLMTGVLFCPPLLEDESVWQFRARDGNKINLLQVVPLHPEELAFKQSNGSDPLVRKLLMQGAFVSFDPKRPNAIKRKKFFGLF